MRADIGGRSRAASLTGQPRHGIQSSTPAGAIGYTWETYSPDMGAGTTVCTADHAITGDYRLWADGQMDMVAIRAILDPAGELGAGGTWSFTLPPSPLGGAWYFGYEEEKGAVMSPLDGWHGSAYVIDTGDSLFHVPNLPYYSGLAVPSFYLPPGSDLPALSIVGLGDAVDNTTTLTPWSSVFPEWGGGTWAGGPFEPAIHIATYGRFIAVDTD